MTYVDLNPVRAGAAQDLPNSDHTSVKLRLAKSQTDDRAPLVAVAGIPRLCFAAVSESDYIRLVDWTGRQLHPRKRGIIRADAGAASTPASRCAVAYVESCVGVDQNVVGVQSRTRIDQ